MRARCRLCRRRGNADKMLLCDKCDRGHHMFCLKPPMTVSGFGWCEMCVVCVCVRACVCACVRACVCLSSVSRVSVQRNALSLYSLSTD